MADRGLIFGGWPSTFTTPEKKEIKIVARYMTPALEKLTRAVRVLGIFCIIGYFLYFYSDFLLHNTFESSYPYIECLIYVALWYVFAKFALPFLCRIKVIIIFNHDLIKIKIPFKAWRKLLRREGHNFGYSPTQKEECFSYYLNHVEGFIPFPAIYGSEKLNILHNRIETVDLTMNNWHPEGWGHLAVDRWDFSDLRRSEWPMTDKEKQTYLIREPFWLGLGYIAGGMGVMSLASLSFFLLHKFGNGWVYIFPPGEVGETGYFWFCFLAGNISVLFLLIGRRFHYLFQMLRFLKRSGRIKGLEQSWDLEPGGFLRLYVGLIHWAFTFIIAMPLVYAGTVYGLEALNEQYVFFSTFLNGWRGLVFGIFLGGFCAFVLEFIATFIKAFLDFPWRVGFDGRDMGIRDLMIYFHDIDEA